MLALCPPAGRNDCDVFVPGGMQKALKNPGRWNDREQLINQERAYQCGASRRKPAHAPGDQKAARRTVTWMLVEWTGGKITGGLAQSRGRSCPLTCREPRPSEDRSRRRSSRPLLRS